MIFFLPALPLLASATGKLAISVLALQQVNYNLEQLRLEEIEEAIKKNEQEIINLNIKNNLTNTRIDLNKDIAQGIDIRRC